MDSLTQPGALRVGQSDVPAGRAALRRLARETALAGVGYALATGLAYGVLRRAWEPASAARWVSLGLVALTYLFGTLYRRLGDNHPPGEEALYRGLGLANHVSLLRGLLLAWLAGFIFSPRPTGWLGWVPGVLYTTAILIDYGDGILARVTHHTSALGQALDTELDALGILIAPALGIWWGQLPAVYGLVAVAYYAFTLGKWLRARQNKPLHPLPPGAIRRPMAGIQMGFISAVLWPLLHPPLTTIAAIPVMIPFVLGFARDWLAVSGRVDANSGAYRRWMGRVSTVAQRWLPVALRVVVAGVFASVIGRTGRVALFEGMGLVAAVWTGALALLVTIGWLGRLAGTLLAIFVSIAAVRWEVTPEAAVLIGCGLGLMLLGTGAGSLWQPEEAFLQSHYGGEG